MHEDQKRIDELADGVLITGLAALEESDLASESPDEELEDGLDDVEDAEEVWDEFAGCDWRRDSNESLPVVEQSSGSAWKTMPEKGGTVEFQISDQAIRRVQTLKRRLAPVLEIVVPRVPRALGIDLQDHSWNDGASSFGAEPPLFDREAGSEMETVTKVPPVWDAEDEELAEELAAQTGAVPSDAEATALAGGLILHLLAPAPPEVKRLAPILVRRLVRLVRLFRRSSYSRPLVLALPTILRRTVASLMESLANSGQVGQRNASHALALETLWILERPRRTAVVLTRNQILRDRLRGRARGQGPGRDGDHPANTWRRTR